MKYETVQALKDEDFKRSVGVQRSTFEKMLEVVTMGWRDFGRPPKLSRADQLLLTLMYWREYRTEFHIGLTYGVSEATVCRTIKKVENMLIKSPQFHLPGKKALQPSDPVIEMVLIDATEQPIERPQKDNAGTTAAKRSVILRKPSSLLSCTQKKSWPLTFAMVVNMTFNYSSTAVVSSHPQPAC